MDINYCCQTSQTEQMNAINLGEHPNGVPIQPEGKLNRPIRDDKPFEELVFPHTTIGQLLQGIVRSYLIKQEPRIGWARKSVCSESELVPYPCESVAAHQWGVSWLVMCISQTKEFQEELPEFDQLRAHRMSMAHDMPELVTGDITPMDGVSPELKHKREASAMESILSAYPDSVKRSLKSDYQNYENRTCLESKFVKDCDRLDFMLQAFVYERQGFSGFKEFYNNSKKEEFSTRIARDLADLLTNSRNNLAQANKLYVKQK